MSNDYPNSENTRAAIFRRKTPMKEEKALKKKKKQIMKMKNEFEASCNKRQEEINKSIH